MPKAKSVIINSAVVGRNISTRQNSLRLLLKENRKIFEHVAKLPKPIANGFNYNAQSILFNQLLTLNDINIRLAASRDLLSMIEIIESRETLMHSIKTDEGELSKLDDAERLSHMLEDGLRDMAFKPGNEYAMQEVMNRLASMLEEVKEAYHEANQVSIDLR